MKKISVYFAFLFIFQEAETQVTSPSFDPGAAARLQYILDSVITNLYPENGAVCAFIVPGQGTWIGVSGYSYDDVPLTADMKFNVASNTKVFTATLIFKLQELGLLDVNNPIGDYLAPIENVDPQITIYELLNHTAGVFDVLNDDPFGNLYYDSMEDTGHVWTFEEQALYIQEPMFDHRKSWKYSNSNYLLAGMIIEAVTGNSYLENLHQYILDPLEMDSTFLSGYEMPVYPVAHVIGEIDYGEFPVTSFFSAVGCYGGLFSTAYEMAQWQKALYEGEILSLETVNEMISAVPEFIVVQGGPWLDYYLDNAGQHHKVFSHGGDLFNFHSQAAYDPDTKTGIAILTNAPYPAQHNLMRPLLRELYYGTVKAENDAGIDSILSPASDFCEFILAPEVMIRNYGDAVLNSVEIHYGIVGEENIFHWTGSLDKYESEIVVLDEIAFEAGNHSFYSSTAMPNGVEDSINFNDTLFSRFNMIPDVVITAPWLEDFESGNNVYDQWINNEFTDYPLPWMIADYAAYSGNFSLCRTNWFDGLNNRERNIISPVINLMAVENPQLSFMVSYAYITTRRDTLQIFASGDCGESFTMIFNQGGEELETNGNFYTFLISDSADFEMRTADLSAFAGGDVILQFKIINRRGNNIFIDDVRVDEQMVSIAEVDQSNVIIYPNPFHSDAIVRMGQIISNGTFSVYNLMGECVSIMENISTDNFSIQRENLPAGNYFFSITRDGEILYTGQFAVD